MRGKSKQRGYGVRGNNCERDRIAAATRSRRYFGRDCRTTLAARNGEDFSSIPESWCKELLRVSRIVASNLCVYDVDEAADFAVYSCVKVLSDIKNKGEELDNDKLFSICYSYCLGSIKSLLTNRRMWNQRFVHGVEFVDCCHYDLLIDESAITHMSDRAQKLLNAAIEYCTTHKEDRTLTYTTKGNIRVRSSYKNDELSLFTVARLHLGWASSTASRVVNEIRDDFFPNYCIRM